MLQTEGYVPSNFPFRCLDIKVSAFNLRCRQNLFEQLVLKKEKLLEQANISGESFSCC